MQINGTVWHEVCPEYGMMLSKVVKLAIVCVVCLTVVILIAMVVQYFTS